MAQLIIAVMLTVGVVAFAMSNAHHVQMSAVLGEPIRIRLFFLLAVFYVAGAMTAFFFQLVARMSRRHERFRDRPELGPDRDEP